MAAASQSDQLIDVLRQIQARKTVKPEAASKALAQYMRVQDHIKELKEQIELFKTVNGDIQKPTGGRPKAKTKSDLMSTTSVTPSVKPSPRATTIRKPAANNVQPTNDVKPKQSHKASATTIKSNPSKTGEKEDGSNVPVKNKQMEEKDKEIARLRMQNAQFKIMVERRVVEPLQKAPNGPAPSTGGSNNKFASALDKVELQSPEKLSEEFKKIYDQEWKSAYYDLVKHYKLEENKITELLGAIAKEAYYFCNETAKIQFEDITKGHAHVVDAITNPRYISPGNKDVFTAKSKSIIDKDGYQLTRKFLKYYRSIMAKVPLPGLIEIFENIVQKDVLPRHTSLRITPKATRPYIHRLIERVWFMSIHDPALVQVWARTGQIMNRDMFSAYSKKGATVIHTVWPAILYQKDGLVAEKGLCLVK